MPKQKALFLTNYKESESKLLTKKVKDILTDQDFEIIQFDVLGSTLDSFRPGMFDKVITCLPRGSVKLPNQKEAFMSVVSGLAPPDVKCVTCTYSEKDKRVLFHEFKSDRDYSDSIGFTSPHLASIRKIDR